MNNTALDRRAEMLRLVKAKGTASISEIATAFDVSEMTVRRTLHKLADSGLVIRTPGGAMALPTGSVEKSFLDRAQKMAAEKDAIGRAAATLVKAGETVVLDSGTTTRYIARHLSSAKNVTVITPSLAVLEELSASEGVRVRLTGGVYRRASHDLVGPAVAEALDGIHADKVFFGAAALSFTKGLMNYDVEMPSSLLRAGRERILVLDASKIGTEAVYRLCAVGACDLIITDSSIKPGQLARLRKVTNTFVAR